MAAAADSGARPGVAGTIGAVGVDMQRWGEALDDLPRDASEDLVGPAMSLRTSRWLLAQKEQ
jgi:hypothetical protein